MGRFESTVGVYARAREPYGPAFFAAVARGIGLTRRHRLLDLGTGPGLLALGLAPYCGEVVGVDPEPAMLRAAGEAAAAAGVALRLVEGRTETLPPDLGRFDVVTIGRALHWMDPEPTRRALDRLLAAEGSIVICRSKSVADGRNAWLDAYEAARRRWTEDPGSNRYRIDLDAFFAGTRFRRGPVIAVESSRRVAVTGLIDRVLSMSSSSPERLGSAAEAMAEALREALAPFARDGAVEDIVEARAECFSSRASGEPVAEKG